MPEATAFGAFVVGDRTKSLLRERFILGAGIVLAVTGIAKMWSGLGMRKRAASVGACSTMNPPHSAGEPVRALQSLWRRFCRAGTFNLQSQQTTGSDLS